MEFGHNLAKDGKSSTKVHYGPGGASSFSLGHDGADDDRFAHKKGPKAEKIDPAAMVAAGEKKEEKVEEEKKEEPVEAAKTSVKVHAPPGGISQITFG